MGSLNFSIFPPMYTFSISPPPKKNKQTNKQTKTKTKNPGIFGRPS